MLVHSMGRRYFLLHYTIFISIYPFRCLLAVLLCFSLFFFTLSFDWHWMHLPWPEYDFISIHSHEPRILEPRESFSILNNCSFFILSFFFSLFILSQFIGNNNHHFQSNSIIRSIQLLDIVIILCEWEYWHWHWHRHPCNFIIQFINTSAHFIAY